MTMETITSSRDAILGDIRKTLNRNAGSPVAPRPPIVPPRVPGSVDEEIGKLMAEVVALKGSASRLNASALKPALADLIKEQNIRKVVLWNTERLNALGVADMLRTLDVQIIPYTADKHAMAEADLGITEADFALPETGTIGMYSSADKPRSVSLSPRVHLAIVHKSALRADLHQVFAEAKSHNYLVFVTGPSRTADIELILTIGVHGPKAYYLWIVDD
jgi:L-lactate dehydrogenase complex protein LldG